MNLIRTAEEYLKAIKDLVWEKDKDKIKAFGKQLSHEELYRAKRLETEERFAARRAGEPREAELSPSDKYKLVVTPYNQGKGYWSYSQGDVYVQGSDKPLFSVKRNYSHFPFAWIENHPDGHDYMICGEDYQGHTVLQLDTGKRRDYFPRSGHDGVGWCMVDFHPSPKGDMIAIEGCHWACPYEVKIFDFRKPLDGPLRVLSDEKDYSDYMGWKSDTACMVGFYGDWCIPLEKWEHELTPEEQDKYIMDLPDEEYDNVWEEGKARIEDLWERPTDLEIALKRVKETQELMARCRGTEHWNTRVPDAVEMANKMIKDLDEKDQLKIRRKIGTLKLEANP